MTTKLSLVKSEIQKKFKQGVFILSAFCLWKLCIGRQFACSTLSSATFGFNKVLFYYVQKCQYDCQQAAP